MSYRKEIEALILELREVAQDIDRIPPPEREKRLRQAEVLDFLINHPEDAIANLDTE